MTIELFTYMLPITITALLAVFYFHAKRSRDLYKIMAKEASLLPRSGRDESAKDQPIPIRELMKRDDVTLRLLEEIHESSKRSFLHGAWPSSTDAIRLRHLENIEAELKRFMRESVSADDFPAIRDRTLGLLDELRLEKQKLAQKEPFNEIQDPEKSLLIDIFHELPAANAIVRQKAVQLSNIIKIKHQDIAKLQEENSRAARWTRWGTAGTVFFGFLSLALSLAPLWSKP